MNHIYRIVFNRSLGLWQAVAEFCTGARKGSGSSSTSSPGTLSRHRSLLSLSLLLAAGQPWAAPSPTALPSGGVVTAGSAHISQDANRLTINQQTPKTAINWQSFDIGRDARVDFVQPSSSAIALNRVLGADGSQILGQLNANGQVFLINPNGVLFGQSASVNVGGLVASTLNLSDSDFMAGNYRFSGKGKDSSGGAVINQGRITAANGGVVALLGGSVSNQGTIQANLGTVALAAGNQISLDFAGDGLLNLVVDESALNAQVENRQLIRANGGQVVMTAKATGALLQTVVNNTGIVQAQTLHRRKGKILLLGGANGGTVKVAGTLDASAPARRNAKNQHRPQRQNKNPRQSDGGFIETSGANIQIAEGAVITAGAAQGKGGQWLIDPYDLTVDAAAASTISTTLNTGTNVGLQTTDSGSSGPGTPNATGNGDIFINSAITWNANSTLTLDAYRSVEVNAPITATGSGAGLKVLTNQGGSSGDFYVNSTVNLPVSGSLTINGQGYTLIDSFASLSNLSGRYALVGNIAANVTAPLGNLTGTLEGLGHTVGIDIDSSAQYVGLFGQILGGGTVRNLGLSGSVRGDVAGMLAGANAGSIVNVRASGSAVGRYGTELGGLVGQNTGSIRRGSAEVNVTGSVDTGRVGGLVGLNNGGSISDSHATGTVTGNRSDGNTGGLVGVNGTSSGGSITRSYATGAVTNLGVGAAVGGLVGISNGGSISHAYATGAVTGNSSGSAVQAKAGGLVGALHGGSLNEVWASGAVSAQHAGGLVGWSISGPTVNAAHWDTQTTGRSNEIGYGSFYVATNVSGLSTAQSFDLSNYTGFTAAEWITVGGQTRPFLASEFSYAIGNAHQLQLMASNLTGSYTLVRDIDASETGAFATNPSSMWGQAGFVPVGSDPDYNNLNPAQRFRGTLDGQYHVIHDLHIDVNTGVNNGMAGLFGSIGSGGVVRRVGLLNPVVKLTGTTGWGYYQAGAIAGENRGRIEESFVLGADVQVSSAAADTHAFAGGLVGWNETGSTVTQSYATGTVQATAQQNAEAGGLVGRNNSVATLSQSWAAVTAAATAGTAAAGGLVGQNWNDATISSSVWDNGLMAAGIGAAGVGGVTGLDATQMTDITNFTAWGADISANGGESTVWRIYDGHTAPLLRGFLKPLAVSATPDYNGSGTALTNIASVTLSGVPAGDTHVLGTATVTPGDTLTLSSPAAGSYTATSNATVSGLYSDQLGYDIVVTSTRTIGTPGSAAGDIRLDNGVAWDSGTLVIDTSGTVTANGAMAGGADSAFRLVDGAWHQNAASLPGFTVDDFQLAGGSFLRAVGGDGSSGLPYLLTDIYGLQGMASSALLGQHFALANDIDASGTANWNGGAGFVPVGNEFSRFTGSFDGGGHSIGHLTIDRAGQNRVGLFGDASGALLQNVTLTDATVTGKDAVGALVGFMQNGTIRNSASEGGTVRGGGYVGGLAGSVPGGTAISGSHATGVVAGASWGWAQGSGGLVGGMFGNGNSISDSWADVTVSGMNSVGGLAGWAQGMIAGSHATGDVTSSADSAGGLVGTMRGSLSNSYATGEVAGVSSVGGLVGTLDGASSQAEITQSYASGRVGGQTAVGGLLGLNYKASVGESYATGEVAGNAGETGGLIGRNNIGSASASFFATTDAAGNAINVGLDVVGQTTGSASVDALSGGKTRADLQKLSTFTAAGWDISAVGGESSVWRIYEGSTAPLLRSFMQQLTVTVPAGGTDKTYDGQIASGTLGGYTTSPSADTSLILGSINYATTSANAGTYSTTNDTLQLGGLYSTQQGYDISYAGASSLTIDKADATVTANSNTLAYNGQTQSVTGFTASGLVNGEDASVLTGLTETGGTGRNAGNYAHSLGVGSYSGNYTLNFVPGSLTINKAALTISSSDVTKTYDGTTIARGALLVSGGQLFGTDSLSGGHFAFANPDIGINKRVLVSGASIHDGNGGHNYSITYADNTNSRILMAPGTLMTSDLLPEHPDIPVAEAVAIFIQDCGIKAPVDLHGQCPQQ